MATRLLRARIGYARIPSTATPDQAAYTQQIRSQMKAIETNLSSVIAAIQDAGPDIVLAALQPTYDKSQVYVPKKTGALAASGYLEVTESGGNTIVQMGYGKGGQPPYAVFVHERTDLFHEPPTRSKFLQAALEEDIGDINTRLQEGYKALIT